MSNTEVGEHTDKKYFVFIQHNAVVRLDVMVCIGLAIVFATRTNELLALPLEFRWKRLQQQVRERFWLWVFSNIPFTALLS